MPTRECGDDYNSSGDATHASCSSSSPPHRRFVFLLYIRLQVAVHDNLYTSFNCHAVLSHWICSCTCTRRIIAITTHAALSVCQQVCITVLSRIQTTYVLARGRLWPSVYGQSRTCPYVCVVIDSSPLISVAVLMLYVWVMSHDADK